MTMQLQGDFSVLAGHADAWAHAEAAMRLLQQHGLMPSALNYALMLAITSGVAPMARDAIAEMGKRGEALDDTACERLFGAYATGALAKIHDEAGARLREEIERMSGAVERHHRVTSHYTSTVDDALATIELEVDTGNLADAVRGLLHGSRLMAFENRALQEALEQTRAELARLREEVALRRTESLTDTLTGVPNRRAFDQKLAQLFEENRPIGLLMIDIDHFKAINDQHGHGFGDQVLRLIASVIGANVRDGDLVARIGGEEFALVMDGAGESEALIVAEKVRKAIAARKIVKRGSGSVMAKVSISVGIATRRVDDDPQSLLDRADAGLYRAKEQGRNCVVVGTRKRSGATVALAME
ncbi:MAG: diguanylate cyclase [Salinarimonas sp.]